MPAPLINAALSSICSCLAKNGLDLLASVFRGSVDKGTDKVADLIEEKTGIDISKAAENRGLTDDELVNLKDFELKYQEQIIKYAESVEELSLDREEAYLADIKDARAMQISAMSSSDEYVRRFVYQFALLLTVLSFGFVYVILIGNDYYITKNNKDMVNMILGFLLGTTLSTIIGFFYGSSKSSGDKSKQITALTNQVVNSTAANNRPNS